MIREPKDLAPFIDHTLLKPEATLKDIERLCGEARTHSFKAVA
jgi:deoxyribose-phosphate aldolase